MLRGKGCTQAVIRHHHLWLAGLQLRLSGECRPWIACLGQAGDKCGDLTELHMTVYFRSKLLGRSRLAGSYELEHALSVEKYAELANAPCAGHPGEHLSLVGNHPAFGCWDLDKAFVLK
jgi:hypothetical protein